MATGQTLIDEALRDLGIIASGAAGDATESAECLIKLNRMLNSWEIDGFMIFTIQRTTHTLTPALNPHTIGPSGTFNVDRPVRIYGAGVTLSGEDVETPLDIFETWRDYQAIPDKTISTTPRALYYDGDYTSARANIFLYPVPDAADTLVLYSPLRLGSSLALGTTISFAPGYEQCILYNLEVLLAPSYGVSDAKLARIEKLARIAKAEVSRQNSRTPNMQTADFGVSPGGAAWRDYRVGPIGW